MQTYFNLEFKVFLNPNIKIIQPINTYKKDWKAFLHLSLLTLYLQAELGDIKI
jgi:hypothetical protein